MPHTEASPADLADRQPGSAQMPAWSRAELPEPPTFTWRNWLALIGPGLMMGGAAVGGGEWLTGPLVTARYGAGLFWLATLSILAQVLYNVEISRYTLYCGEPIFTGKCRTPPGPWIWLPLYLLLDLGAFFPYLAASAATPLAAVLLGHLPQTQSPEVLFTLLGVPVTQAVLLRALGYVIFLGAMVPLIFGGKVYSSLKAVMTFKVVTVLFLLGIIAVCYTRAGTWWEIAAGFFKFGNVPVQVVDDPGGDAAGAVAPEIAAGGAGGASSVRGRGAAGNGPGPAGHAAQPALKPGRLENIFVALFEGRRLQFDLSQLGIIGAMVAISGLGGLSNTPVSNYTRDQGWGMGRHVGAIPSVVGGHKITLSHVGCVFRVTAETAERFRRWYRHVLRDQLVLFMPACFIGLALPSILSIEFLPRGTHAESWTAAGMTADGVAARVAEVSGPALGRAFWVLVLFCGFLTLAPTTCSSADGTIRRWVDVLWTCLPPLRKLDPKHIGRVYFTCLCAYICLGLVMLTFVHPGELLKHATTVFNYALGFSFIHVVYVNTLLLPRAVRPSLVTRGAMLLGALFFLAVAAIQTYVAVWERTAAT